MFLKVRCRGGCVLSKCVKRMMLDNLSDVLKRSQDFIVIDSSRVSAAAVNQIRLDFSDANVCLLGVKNAIAVKTFEEVGVSGTDRLFGGPSSIVYGDVDVVALSKRVVHFADTNKSIVIRGGIIDGQVVDNVGVVSISKSPGRLELLSNLSGLFVSQGMAVSSIVLSSGGLIASQISQVASKFE